MTYLITTRNGIKIVVKTTLTRPCESENDPAWELDYDNRQREQDEWDNHFATLPAIILPESLQHLPVGSEVEGREQWQVDVGGWIDCSEAFYNSISGKRDRRIILVADEGEKEQDPCNYCGKSIREQMKGCNYIACYRQHLKNHPPSQEAPKGEGVYTTEQIIKAAWNAHCQLAYTYQPMSYEKFSKWFVKDILSGQPSPPKIKNEV